MDQKKLQLMQEGGQKLARILQKLTDKVAVGVTPLEIEALATDLIKKSGGKASFKMVKGYHHATCINVNDGLVHGIPTSTPFKKGDLVTIDIGLLFQGYHTDTSATVVVGKSTRSQTQFLSVGQQALKAGIKAALVGAHVSDISQAIQKVIEASGYSVIKELTGHGVGRALHEDPYIPNYFDPHAPNPQLYEGQTIAIEPMYSAGAPYLTLAPDGWTLSTSDGSLTAVFEHTIYITKTGPQILTTI